MATKVKIIGPDAVKPPKTMFRDVKPRDVFLWADTPFQRLCGGCGTNTLNLRDGWVTSFEYDSDGEVEILEAEITVKLTRRQ